MSRVVMIVGAGPGLGIGIAKRFAAEGYSAGLIAHNSAGLEVMRSELSDAGQPVAVALADVSKPDELRAALASCERELGPPDVVVPNTSMMIESMPTQVDPMVFETTWKVVCLSTLIALQAVAPGMIARGSGAFLAPGTALAIRPWALGAALGSAKAASRNLVMAAHEELKPLGIHATVITIDGMIKAGTAFDPAHIADCFWQVSQVEASGWAPEITFKGG